MTVALIGPNAATTTTGAGSAYQFSAVADGTYTVTPKLSGYSFSPVSIAKTVHDASLSGINFAATATSATTYTLSGTVAGAVASNVIVTLNGVDGGSAATDMGGNYSFTDLAAGTYSVSASSAGYAFTKAQVVSIGTSDSPSNNFTSTVSSGEGPMLFAPVNPLPQATIASVYSTTVVGSVAGGAGPYVYQTDTWANGAPPPGMVLNPNGNLTGTPSVAGNYTFGVCATDAAGHTTSPCPTTTITVATASSTITSVPPPTSNTNWVYHDGVFHWQGDYSFSATANYTDTSGGPLSGAYDIQVNVTGPYGGWLPYSTPHGPYFNSAGYTKLTFALKPTVQNQKWNVYFVKAGDIEVGIYLDPSNYGPAPVAGQWATYTIPLADLGVLGTLIYKFSIHDETGLSNNTWYVDNVGFVP